jgi:hypothetical protein
VQKYQLIFLNLWLLILTEAKSYENCPTILPPPSGKISQSRLVAFKMQLLQKKTYWRGKESKKIMNPRQIC